MLTEAQQAEKREITVDYTAGLIEKCGISTDVFKSEVMKDFFDNVFFGAAGYPFHLFSIIISIRANRRLSCQTSGGCSPRS